MSLWKELSEELERRADYLSRVLKDSIINVDSKNLNDVLSNNKVVFLYFTAEWCGPCVNFYKTYREVATKLLKPGVAYCKVDVDAAYSVADKYKVKHIPSILVIVDGKVVDSIVGQVSAEELERRMKSYVSQQP